MMLYNPSHHPALPGAMICQPACLLSFPSSVEVDDSWLNGGSGVGHGSSSIKSGLGEYFERRHFYMEVKSGAVGDINFSLSKSEADKFLYAFSQTNSNNLTSAQLSSHLFNLVQVYRTSDFSSCYVPTACVSLNYRGIESENVIYPLRDTCGCSFHWSFEKAAFGSIKESLERQFLTRFWLTKKCSGLISDLDVNTALEGRHSRALYNALNKSGELAVIDISDAGYPGVCLLTVYGQKNNKFHVQYCAGMSYAETLGDALEKSIHELWQTYRFIDLFRAIEGDERKIDDPYLRHFLSCNSYETFKEITTIEVVGGEEPNSMVEFSLCGLLLKLEEKKIDGYLYVSTTTINDEVHHFCKFVSPDLFLHMNNSKSINIFNKYSSGFVDQIITNRRNTMVPFP